MKKMIALAVLFGSLALTGCSPSNVIEGSPKTVISECQDVANDEEVEIKVSGQAQFITSQEDANGDMFTLIAVTSDGGDPSVMCYFRSPDDGLTSELEDSTYSRITVQGDLMTEYIDAESVSIDNCTLVE